MCGALQLLSYLWDLVEQEQGSVKDALKSSFGVVMEATRGGSFYGKEGFSLNTAVLKIYCKFYWVL